VSRAWLVLDWNCRHSCFSAMSSAARSLSFV